MYVFYIYFLFSCEIILMANDREKIGEAFHVLHKKNFAYDVSNEINNKGTYIQESAGGLQKMLKHLTITYLYFLLPHRYVAHLL